MEAAAHEHSVLSSASSQQPGSIKEVLSMSKGDGEDSYSKNSKLQQSAVNEVILPNIAEALQKAKFPTREPIVVADLGCSSGPNTIRNVTHIIQKITSQVSDPAPEFQVFFNDLSSNDFNNLFQLFSSEIQGNFFAAGVPGSFHGRLFPRSTVHVFFSTFSLHWLSKIPDAVLDRNSPAYSKDSLWLEGTNAATLAAYKEQSSSDFKTFLHARAAELAPGGLLYAVLKAEGHMKNDSSKKNVELDAALIPLATMIKVWHKLESEGIITKGQTEAFTLPICFRSIQETLADIETCSSAFEVLMAKEVKQPKFYASLLPGSANDIDIGNDPSSGTAVELRKALCRFYKGVFGDLVEKFIGKESSHVLWERFGLELLEEEMWPHVLGDSAWNVVALIRKNSELQL